MILFTEWDDKALSALVFIITYKEKSPYDSVDKALKVFTNTLSVIRIQDDPGRITIVFNKLTWPMEREIAIKRIPLSLENKLYYMEKRNE